MTGGRFIPATAKRRCWGGVGTIRIRSSDVTDPQITLPGIENGAEIARAMDNARRKERMRRGLHVESV